MNKYILLCLVLCLCGCGIEPAKEPIFKFHQGDKVKHVVSGDIGIIKRAYYYYYKPDRHSPYYGTIEAGIPYYNVKFATDASYGVDTASGSGFLGDNSHNAPSIFVTEQCNEWELIKVE